jgi:hypothetical protein
MLYCPMYCLYRLQYHELDTVEVAIPALNRLLKSPEFWGELSAAGVTRTLFFQTDSLLVHGGIQPFMQVGVFSKRELRGVVYYGGGIQPSCRWAFLVRGSCVGWCAVGGGIQPFMLVGC